METFSNIPRTIVEAIKQVLFSWSKEEIQSFRSMSVNDLFDLRNTLGSDIRNVFSLWYGNDELLNDCERFLVRNKEFYDSALWMIEEKEQGKKRVASVELLPDISEEDVLEDDELLEQEDDFFPSPINDYKPHLATDSTVPIDPFIASQVIIFAVWNHLQVQGPTL